MIESLNTSPFRAKSFCCIPNLWTGWSNRRLSNTISQNYGCFLYFKDLPVNHRKARDLKWFSRLHLSTFKFLHIQAQKQQGDKELHITCNSNAKSHFEWERYESVCVARDLPQSSERDDAYRSELGSHQKSVTTVSSCLVSELLINYAFCVTASWKSMNSRSDQ